MTEQNQSQQARPSSAAQHAARIELMPPSFTMRVGNRRLTMSWRPRKQVPALLSGLLHRSWRAMFGKSVRMSMTAAAICAAWNVPAMAAGIADNALPTGWSVTAGSAAFSQSGNTLNINQSTPQAIANFSTFNIGKNAAVNISQPSAAAAFLARVTGSDPSQIYGLLKANGTVALINQNGILVGPTGVVDVARFIASTLNISDSDFLAGRLTFANGGAAGKVENQGEIKTVSGGSVYLIGANVDNSGIIRSPNGEILLAAGQTVQLVDTATPGVSVSVTGNAGKVTNLGSITAEAGRIGIAAGLISNSGNINASSVVNDGGRIFLRASQNLTTTASSQISADGAGKGGSVVLYADGAAYLDGGISAAGAPGKGGYVETSGKQSLDVVKVPIVGTGGEWFIDPYDLTVVASGSSSASNSGNVITSTGSSATIEAGTISTQLSQGNSVTLATGAGGSASGGNITVNAAISKNGGSAASLTLNADNNITINADITSTGDKLSLNLNTNVNGATTGAHSVQVNGATIGLNGGTLNVSAGLNGNANGDLSINNGAFLNLSSSLTDSYSMPLGGAVNTGNLTVNAGGTVSNTYGAHVVVNGALLNNGVFNLQNSQLSTTSLSNGASLTLGNVSGTLGAVVNTGTLALTSLFTGVNADSLNNAGTLTLTNGSRLITGTFINGSGASVTVNSSTLNATASLNNLGALAVNNGSTLNAGAVSTSGSITAASSQLNVATLANAVGGSVTLTDSGLSATGQVNNAGQFIMTNSTINTLNGFANLASGVMTMNYLSNIHTGAFNNQGLVSAYGSAGYVTFENGFTNSGLMNLKGSIMANSSANNVQGGTLNLGAAGQVTTLSGSGIWNNDGIITVSGVGNVVNLGGTLTNNATGSVQVSGVASGLNMGALSNSGSVLFGAATSSAVSGAITNNGTFLMTNAAVAAGSFSNEEGSLLSGTGTLSVCSASGTLINGGTVSPGGDNAIGTLSILGGYTQTGKGILKIDVASDTSYDTLGVSAETLSLSGTLITKLLNGYVPTVGTSFYPIQGAYSSTGSFRYVEGDIVAAGGVKNMIKARYNIGEPNAPVRLTMMAPEEITYTGGVESQWGDINNWSSNYIPTAIDSVIFPTGVSVMYQGGGRPETLEKITVGSGAYFTMFGGDLTVNNVSSAGTFNINNGTFTLNGTGRLFSLNLSGTLNGGGNSILNVTDSFQQFGSGSIVSAGDVALSQADGDLVVGSVTARNLVLESQTGAIQQQDTALHVTKQLLTSSVTGTTLTSSTNRIAAFAGNNRGAGNIMLVNNLETADTAAVKFNGITNANGNININNTGGAVTAALGSDADFLGALPTESGSLLSAATRLSTLGITTSGTVSAAGAGSAVTLATHSPLTIGVGGVSATGNIALTAGNSGSSADNLTINGTVTSSGGNITLFAGNNLSVNANIATAPPGQTLFTVVNGVVTYTPGVSITDVNGVKVPVANVATPSVTTPVVVPPVVVPPVVTNQLITPLITPVIQPSVSQIVSTTIKATSDTPSYAPPPIFTASSNSVSTPASTQTVGGTAGTFGGDDSSTPAAGGPASVPKKLPVCT